ncbi:LCP family protein [Candidatus Saccharibacteria bacterium]|nr:LCP family protein [Candidatus Saccharibacteria bacterium]
MPKENRIPKQKINNSIDGLLPQRQNRSKLLDLSGLSSDLGKTPRRPSSSKRQPLGARITRPIPNAKKPHTIGNFDQDEIDPFKDIQSEGFLTDTDKVKLSRQERKKLDKKDKKTGKIRSWWRNRSKKFKILFVVSLIVLSLVGVAGYRLFGFLNSVFGRAIGNGTSAALNGDPNPEDLNTEGDGRLNILLLGRGGNENEAPDLTDTILIASIDLKNQSVSLLSIPRDMYVDDLSYNSKINGVFNHKKEASEYDGTSTDKAEDEGIKATVDAVRNVAGVPIHKYVLTDYKAFRDVVDALGGVDIDVPDAIYDGYTKWSFKKGPQTMNGEVALKYARTRHGSDRGDFDRTENQRRLLMAMRQKATSSGVAANPVRLNSLANAVQKNIRTDLTIDEARIVFDKLKAMPDSSVKSLDLAKPDDPLVTTGNANGQSIVKPVAGLQDYTEIRAYARSNMIDPYLKQESPSVAVYNGSSQEGLATLTADILSSYGYKVLEKETSKEIQNKTLVIKINKDSKKPFTERFLNVRFSTTIISELPGNIIPDETTISTTKSSNESANSKPLPDYIIVLGNDFTIKNGPTW